MATWREVEPAPPPPATPGQKFRGAARLGFILPFSVLCLGLYMLGKALRDRISERLGFQHSVARVWSLACLRAIGVRLQVVGRPMEEGGALVANHASWADVPALRATRGITFVAKAEVRAWPYVGYIAEVFETVFIARRRAETGRQRDELARRIAKGEALCVFAEGTSTDGLRVLPFKSALLSAPFAEAVRTRAYVQPVTINWAPAPGSGLPASFYGWWADMPFHGHIWDVVCRSRGGAVEVVFHEARPAAAFADRKALTEWCEAAVRSAKRTPEPAGPATAGIAAAP